MRMLFLVVGAMILLSGTAVAGKTSRTVSLFKTASAAPIARGPLKARPEFILVGQSPRVKEAALPKTPIADELLPLQLRERSYSDPDTVAGVHLALPNLRALNIVLAADDLLNPTCGIKIHLPW